MSYIAIKKHAEDFWECTQFMQAVLGTDYQLTSRNIINKWGIS